MAKYKRYQKLQKYYLGEPVEPAEYKEGELIGIKDYNSIEECEKYTPQITYNNWVSTTSNFLTEYSNGFTINSLGKDDDGLYHSTIEGAGTELEFFSNEIIYSHYVDLTNITVLKNLFNNNFDYIGGNFTGWNTSKVTDMAQMFWCCYSLKTLDLSSFNTSKVTKMVSMFYNCYLLTALDLSSFDTSKVTDMAQMFAGCSSLTTLDLSSFDTSNVTEMGYMFDGCSSLTALDLSSFNTSKVIRMYNMFHDCNSLKELNISGWNLINQYNNKNAHGMFINCTSLNTIYAYNCNEKTINCINEELSKAGLTDQVTIIT